LSSWCLLTAHLGIGGTAHVIAIGGMLQGLAKPVNDLSRGALVEDLVDASALTATQADSQVTATSAR
jgi:phosphate acetyltransferase